MQCRAEYVLVLTRLHRISESVEVISFSSLGCFQAGSLQRIRLDELDVPWRTQTLLARGWGQLFYQDKL